MTENKERNLENGWLKYIKDWSDIYNMNDTYINLKKLPIKYGIGISKDVKVIDWKNSIGCKVDFKYNNIIGELEIINYDSKYLSVLYLDKEPFKIKTNNFIKCKLGNLLDTKTSKFKIEIGTTFKDDKRDLTIIDREYIKIKSGQYCKYYKYKCNICEYNEGLMIESHLLKGVGCVCCANQVVIEGINDIPTTDPWMIPYFQGGYDEAKLYTHVSNKKLKFKCLDCGRVKDKLMAINTLYNRKSISCICNDGISYPEKFIYSILEQLNITFVFQLTNKNFEWCNKYKYDFYFELDNKKYIIEADGKFHKFDNNMNGQTKEESKSIDDEKDRLAEEHEIEVIRINCELSDLCFIKNKVLKSKLNKLFNLKQIKWSKCEDFALSNLVKKVCKIKRDNPDISTIEIGKTIKIHQSTVIRYLKKGNEIWDWVNYDSKEEMKKGSVKLGKLNGKEVEIFKDGISLGIFPSCAELERKSEEYFSIKLDNGAISKVCNGKLKKYKGFTFKYTE